MEWHKKIEDLEIRVSKLEAEIETLKSNRIKVESGKVTSSNNITFNVPEELVDNLLTMDERLKFPILWYFSDKEIMTVEEFLNACADKGFSLTTSWLPSLGGNFKNRLVKEDKMFHEVDKIGRNKTWKLTDIGILKVKREIEKLKSKKSGS